VTHAARLSGSADGLVIVVPNTSRRPRLYLLGFPMLASHRLDFRSRTTRVSLTNSSRRVRTRAHGGVARSVGERCPYADHTGLAESGFFVLAIDLRQRRRNLGQAVYELITDNGSVDSLRAAAPDGEASCRSTPRVSRALSVVACLLHLSVEVIGWSGLYACIGARLFVVKLHAPGFNLDERRPSSPPHGALPLWLRRRSCRNKLFWRRVATQC
jgi:hypothetical protein